MTTIIAPRPGFRFHPLLWLGAAVLLLVPAAAMQLTAEVHWGPEDFVAFALMLTGFCLMIEIAWAVLTSPSRRFAAVCVAVLAFVTVWAELAVGIFD